MGAEPIAIAHKAAPRTDEAGGDPGTGRGPDLARSALWLVSLLLVSLASRPALAVGEGAGGFPNWAERALHQLANRARVDPQLDMQSCGANCGEKACYVPEAPLYYQHALNRAARFHAAHQSRNGYFAHNSACTLVADIAARFPDSCNGDASCSCVGGVKACSGACTAWDDRIQLFGSSGSGEIIASPSDPESAFYLWLFEPSSATACSFGQANGHRWLLLRSNGAVGFGVSGYSVGDFSSGGDVHEIPSGSHWPRQAESVEIWANYYADAGPRAARVDVDGVCTPMQLARGTAQNGAYQATLSGVGSGCHRYYFHFETDGGALVTFPESGSLGIGPAGSCPDWSSERPAAGEGCTTVPEPASAASAAVALAALCAWRAARRSVSR